jgi:4-hydroxy-tetrahydrodipicolinate reductase
MTGERSYKVIQWATGNIGTKALRAVIDHPQLDLAGLWVSSPEKVGKDAGILSGGAPCGIIATSSVEEMVATPADCVLYMRQGTDIGEICALLASGKNIVTTRGDFHHPALMDPAVRAQVEQACRTGNSSIYSTGSSPGFVTEALPIALLSLSRRLDCLTIEEFGDVSSRNSPDLLFRVMGFGVSPGTFEQRKIDHVKEDFAGSLGQLAEAAGLEIDSWDAIGEMSPARERVEIAAGVVEAGQVAAMRITISGMRAGKPVLRFRANWYCSTNIVDSDWELRESGWRIRVEGDTPLDVHITFPVKPENYAAFTPGLTGHRAVNAVAAVCAAPPGIRTTTDLPQIIAHLG